MTDRNDVERVVLVGGPNDGQQMTIPAGRYMWRTVVPEPPATLYAADFDPAADLYPMPTADYHVRIDGTGRPSRRDDGVLIYDFAGTHGGPPFAPKPEPAPARRCVPNLPLGRGYPVTITCSCGVPVGTAADKAELGRILDVATLVHDW